MSKINVRKRKDYSGIKFGKLTALQYKYSKNNKSYWSFICECGNIVIKNLSDVKRGKVISCGCAKKQHLKSKHSNSHTSLYICWKSMKRRCSTNKHYKNIQVCDEWNNYINFKNWALQNGYSDNLTLDRIDYTGDYEPTNCRWVNSIQQNNNKSNNITITYKGKVQTLKEWCNELDLPYSTIWYRLNRLNYSIEEAFEKEVEHKYGNNKRS